MHPPEVEEMPTSLRFGGKSREVFKVVEPMFASLLHLYWPLRDCDQPCWALREQCTFQGPVIRKHSFFKADVRMFESRFADIRFKIRMLPYYGQLSSSLDKTIFNPLNKDTRWCGQRLLFFTLINKFLDRIKLTSIIWHFVINQLCAVLFLASDEVILGCQHSDVYSATVDGIRWRRDVNFWLFKVLNEFNTQITVFDKVMSANKRT